MSRHSIDDRAWRKLCEQIKERDGWQCAICGSTEDLTVDHVKPLDLFSSAEWEAGLDRNPDNLCTLCRRCNGRKSNRVSYRVPWFNRRWLDRLSF